MTRSLLILPLMLLAACGQGDRDQANAGGAEININAGDKDGGVQITSGKGGSKLAIKGDGVDLDFDLPDFSKIDVAADFDIDGVKLYPGSKVTSVNVDASDKSGADKAIVKLGFTSPTTPAKAAAWMAGEFAKQKVRVTRSGDTLTGKSEDGDDFTIRFSPDGANAKGEALIISL